MSTENKTHDLSEFYGIYNTTFSFIDKKYGYEELVQYWKFIGEEYFSWLIDDIKKRGTEALREYWMESVENDDIKYSLEVTSDLFKLRISSCSAIVFMKSNTHYPLFKKYCEHCRVVNSKIAELSGLEYKVDYNQDKGKCTHIFNK